MAVGDRISLIIKELGITKKKFADSLNISPGHLSDWISSSRKSNPSLKYLSKMYELFDVDLIWLLTGKGDMFLKESQQVCEDTCQFLHIEADIAAGEPLEVTGERLETLTIGRTLIHNVNDYFCFRVNGQSMEPYIEHQDLVIIKKDCNWKDKENTVCAVRVDGEITLKRIINGDKHKLLVLISDNKGYPPIIVDPKHSDVLLIGSLYLVVRRVE